MAESRVRNPPGVSHRPVWAATIAREADAERKRADIERERADREEAARQAAERRTEVERDVAERRIAALEAQLRALRQPD